MLLRKLFRIRTIAAAAFLYHHAVVTASSIVVVHGGAVVHVLVVWRSHHVEVICDDGGAGKMTNHRFVGLPRIQIGNFMGRIHASIQRERTTW